MPPSSLKTGKFPVKNTLCLMLEPNSNALIVEGSALDRMQFFSSEYFCKLLFRKSNLEKTFIF